MKKVCKEERGLRIMRWYGIVLFVLSWGPIWYGIGAWVGALGILFGAVFICLSIVPKEGDEKEADII